MNASAIYAGANYNGGTASSPRRWGGRRWDWEKYLVAPGATIAKAKDKGEGEGESKGKAKEQVAVE